MRPVDGTTLASDTEVPSEVGCECTRPGVPEIDAYDHDACGWGPCGTIELECADLECPPGAMILDVTAHPAPESRPPA